MSNTPTLEKTTAKDFEQTFPLFEGFDNPNITKDQWKRLFIDNWGMQNEYCGYKLVAGGEIVGFVAYILSNKLIDGKWEKFCNLSTWIVQPEYRSSSIDLLYPILDLKDYTITSYTPSIGAHKVESKLFKMKTLDVYESIIPAIPRVSALFRKGFKIILNHKVAEPDFTERLSDYDKTVFTHHNGFGFQHAVVVTGHGNLYLIYKKVIRRHLPFAKFYYISNPDLFLQYFEDFRCRFPLAANMAGIVVDSRFLKGKNVPFKKNKNFYMPMLYRSPHLQPYQVDYLYSEFFLLGL